MLRHSRHCRTSFQRSQHSLRRHECIWVIIACVIVTLSGLPRLIYYAELELHYWVSVLYISKLKERMGRRSFLSISAVNHIWCMSSYSTFTCSLYYKWYCFFIFFFIVICPIFSFKTFFSGGILSFPYRWWGLHWKLYFSSCWLFPLLCLLVSLLTI